MLASLISVKFNQRLTSSTTRLAMAQLIDWAIDLLARRARLVALCSSLKGHWVRTSLILGTEKLGLVYLEDHHMKGRSRLANVVAPLIRCLRLVL